MAKTVFTPGTIVDSDFLNAINNPVFDGQDIDGHRAKISDAELADSGIKAKVDEQLRAFEVTVGSGDAIEISGGYIVGVDNILSSISPTSIDISSDGTYYFFIDRDNEISQSQTIPNVGLLLAKLVVSGASRVITDLRSVNIVRPQSNTIKIFGGHGEQLGFRAIASGSDGLVGDEYQYVNPTIGGLFNVINFTVDAGATVTIKNGAIINCTGEFNVAATGTIVVNTMTKGGGSFSGTITGLADLWANSGLGLGGASGHNTLAADKYTAQSSMIGSGGASAYMKSRINAAPTSANLAEVIDVVCGAGGDGGGYIKVNSVGPILVSGNITAEGGDASDNVYNSGLLTSQFLLAGGAGGGSGGTIWLRSLESVTLANGSVTSVAGGDGGAGYVSANVSATFTAQGGGGGGGGRIILESPSNTTTGATITLAGGNPGVSAGAGGSSVSGSTGGSYGGFGAGTGNTGSLGVLEILTKVPG